MTTRLHAIAWRREERGVALVEFALIFPLFMTLILGMFSGGIAYNQDISLTHAAREGARYAATLPKGSGTGAASTWTTAVRSRVEEASTDTLDAITTPSSGHFMCVALVSSGGAVQTDSGGSSYSYRSPNTPASVPASCYTDGVSDTFGRVHVMVGRPGKIQLLVTSYTLNLRSQATARYENPSP